MPLTIPYLQLADASGFGPLVLIAASSVAMVCRRRMLVGGTNLSTIRWMHMPLSSGAAAFLAVHVSLLVGFSPTIGAVLGYTAFTSGLPVWITGSVFVSQSRVN